MERSKEEKMTRRKIAGIVLAAVTILFIIYCLLFLSQNQNKKIEKGVVKVMETYSENLNDQEVKTLSKDLGSLIDDKLRQIGKDDLTKEQLKELLDMITQEINNKFENLTEKEIHLIANSVLKEIIDQGIGTSKEDQEKLILYKKQIDELTIEIDRELETMIKEFEREISKVETVFNEQTKEIEEHITLLTEHITEVEKKVGELEKKEGELEKKVGDLEKEKNEMEKKISELEAKLKEVTETTIVHEKELESLKERMTNAENGGLYYRFEEETSTLHLFGKEE